MYKGSVKIKYKMKIPCLPALPFTYYLAIGPHLHQCVSSQQLLIIYVTIELK